MFDSHLNSASHEWRHVAELPSSRMWIICLLPTSALSLALHYSDQGTYAVDCKVPGFLKLLNMIFVCHSLCFRTGIWYFWTKWIRYDTRCYFNVRSKADISQLNLPHGIELYTQLYFTIFMVAEDKYGGGFVWWQGRCFIVKLLDRDTISDKNCRVVDNQCRGQLQQPCVCF